MPDVRRIEDPAVMNDDARHLNELVTRKAESLRQLPDPSTLSDQAAFIAPAFR